ncbi:MAG: RNA polymerase subunit sigma, partial [Lachnospiraceae bacterium]|nr:RNA polymerase subunit sigma [Lachnospiraceae bacterium]
TDLYEAIHALPEETGLCVTLHYIEGYKVREIASIMKLTEDVVKKRLMQGRAQLRTLLEDCEEVAG